MKLGRVALAAAGALIVLAVGVPALADATSATPSASPSPTCLRPPASGSVVEAGPTHLTFVVSANGGCGYAPVTVSVYRSFEDASAHLSAISSTAATAEAAQALTVSGLKPGTPYWYRFSGGGSNFDSLAMGPTLTAAAPQDCTATYVLDSAWDTGFVARVIVHNNLTTPIHGWQAVWDWPGQQVMREYWNGTPASKLGTVTVTSADWNGTLQPAGEASFGYVGAGPAPATLTISCLVTPTA
ncbi:MAG: hypothetical protein HOV77_16725 [Hamadaea sp.]|uniref:cellulose binding domain-containing protein n=1 Tax=Hamadaea sp. TaxID=2024425 RepID=UPI0017D1D2EF|nr:cellulose binding domain-containing protein [Hamadaea sp.]NUT20826.1 hypothetical protein [Hamadaea sp.]